MSAASHSVVRPLPLRARRFAAGAAVVGFVAAAIALVGVVPGCGGSSPDYYCDATGCFQCDGFGCAAVTPPTPDSCQRAGDKACKVGFLCTDRGCLASCKDDSACEKGFVCNKASGLCASPTGPDPKPLVCAVAADCGASGFDCVDGACVVVPACTGVGCSCKYSSECGDGRVCANGACADACDATTPCATGFKCDANGVCQRSAAAVCGPNAGNAACASGQHCVDGQCAAGCSADAPCLGADGKADPQQQCLGGACVPDPHPVTNCSADTQCKSGSQKCLDGFCRYTCTTSDMCKSIDSRIGTCAKDGVCRSDSEANAQCLAQSDCTSGKSCIDGQCK